MRTRGFRVTAVLGLCSLAACYHQVVDTGLPAGDRKIEKPWTATWIFGLVPATPIDVRRECTSGVAIVDTQMTFLNGLVSGITFGIYTPRSVSITCAARSAANGQPRIEVGANASQLQVALRNASELSESLGRGVYVVFASADGDTHTTSGGTQR